MVRNTFPPFEHLHNAYTQVTRNMQEARDHNKSLISNTAIPSNFKPGDPVFYFDPSVQPGDSTKLTLYWKNYFRVVSKIGNENYCIKNMHTGKTKIVHSENLRHRDSNDVWDRTYTSLRPSIQVSNMPEERPSRQQPLRAARLPFSDQVWYGDFPEWTPNDSPIVLRPEESTIAEQTTKETVGPPEAIDSRPLEP